MDIIYYQFYIDIIYGYTYHNQIKLDRLSMNRYICLTVVLQSCFGLDNFLYMLWIWCTIRDMIYVSAYK